MASDEEGIKIPSAAAVKLQENFIGRQVDEFRAEDMQVVAIDANALCLKILVALLKKCKYQVTATTKAAEALRILGENRNKFGIVIINVLWHDNYDDAFKFLEIVGGQFNVPVIIVSADDRTSTIEKSMRYGAVHFLSKPVRINEARIIWQHAVRKRMQDSKLIPTRLLIKSPNTQILEQKVDTNNNNNALLISTCSQRIRKARTVWTDELHNKFLAAVEALGYNAKPKQIVEAMNVKGISRQTVTSHLQRHRTKVKNGANNKLKLNRQTNKKVKHSEEEEGSYTYQRNPGKWNDYNKQALVGKSTLLPVLENTWCFMPTLDLDTPTPATTTSSSTILAEKQLEYHKYSSPPIISTSGPPPLLFNLHSGAGSSYSSNYRGFAIESVRDSLQKLASTTGSSTSDDGPQRPNTTPPLALALHTSNNSLSAEEGRGELLGAIMGGGEANYLSNKEAANFMKQNQLLLPPSRNSNFLDGDLAVIVRRNDGFTTSLEVEQPIMDEWENRLVLPPPHNTCTSCSDNDLLLDLMQQPVEQWGKMMTSSLDDDDDLIPFSNDWTDFM